VKPRSRTTLFVGVDPGRKGGLAFFVPGQETVSVMRVIGAPSMTSPLPVLAEMAASGEYELCAVVERCRATMPKFRAHRAAANLWIGYLRSQFARHNSIRTADPQAWQSSLGVQKPGAAGWAMPYDAYAKEFACNVAPEDLTEDQAAAICILHYGCVNRIWGAEAVAKLPKLFR